MKTKASLVSQNPPHLGPRTRMRALGFLVTSALVTATLGIGTPASAQVNTERLRKGATKEGRSGSFHLGLSLREGNTDTLGLATGFRISQATIAPIRNASKAEIVAAENEAAADEASQAGTESEGGTEEKETNADELSFNPRLVFLVAEYELEEAEDRRTVNDAFAHLRWTEMKSPRFGYEAFLQVQTNEFQRLDRRTLVGGGVRLGVYRSADGEVFVGSGYMFERERLDLPRGTTGTAGATLDETDHHRWTNYLTLRLELLEERLLLLATTYVQPRFDEFEDLRVLHEAEIGVPLTEHVSLGFNLTLVYDSRPPLDIKDTDLTLENRFRYSF